MRFTSLKVSNLRGIAQFELNDLKDVVVIAGPNGSGKSAALDAIRLLKSFYGGYNQNEYQNWFGEFQININRREELLKILRWKDQPVLVEATIEISEDEQRYLDENMEELLEELAWSEANEAARRIRTPLISTEGAVRRNQIRESAKAYRESLPERSYALRLEISPSLGSRQTQQPIVSLLFRTYKPQHLGVIDYHNASRSYEREAFNGVNLNLDSLEDQYKQTALYNSRNKYQNIKSKLASTYVRGLVAQKSGVPSPESTLSETLTELFQTFFPDKSFDGPVPKPDGSLDFPVRLSTGEVHDIDDLSSGEKEVLYGYLRLSDSAPRNSVILLDEPELHLNPGLLQGFPDFYHKHLGQSLNNQIWMTTHSDTLLRQAVGNPSFSVFHMRTPAASKSENQALRIEVESEIEQAVIDLVGDLATYKPRADIVILEGSGLEFDASMLKKLKPDFAQSVNIVSGGAKRRVRDLYGFLDEAAQKVHLERRFFAIVDRDRDPPGGLTNVFTWDSYHIENYLLEPTYILAAVRAVSISSELNSTSEVLDALRACAEEIMPTIVLEELQTEVNNRLVRAMSIRSSGNSGSASSALRPSIETTVKNLQNAAEELLAAGNLASLEQTISQRLTDALANDKWIKDFPGRSILHRFVSRYVKGVDGNAFRNLILDKMTVEGYVPPGIQNVVNQIVEAQAQPHHTA